MGMRKKLFVLCFAASAMSALAAVADDVAASGRSGERKSGETRTIVLPGGAKMEMIWCAPGKFKILRGGCWFFYESDCRCAYRLKREPNLRNCIFGFRLACSDCDAVCSSTVSRPK